MKTSSVKSSSSRGKDSGKSSSKGKDKDSKKKKDGKSKRDKDADEKTEKPNPLSLSIKDAMKGVKAKPIEYDDEREYAQFFEKNIYPFLHRLKQDLVDSKPRSMVIYQFTSARLLR